jgi:hypothetical protein
MQLLSDAHRPITSPDDDGDFRDAHVDPQGDDINVEMLDVELTPAQSTIHESVSESSIYIIK